MRLAVAAHCPQVRFCGWTEQGARIGEYRFWLMSGRSVVVQAVQAPTRPTGELRRGVSRWRFRLTRPRSGHVDDLWEYVGDAETLDEVVDWICAHTVAEPQERTAVGASRDDVKAAYYVYENYPTDRATVHAASCGFCNDGRGRKGQPVTPNGKWHGPFSTKSIAEDAAKRTGRSCSSHTCTAPATTHITARVTKRPVPTAIGPPRFRGAGQYEPGNELDGRVELALYSYFPLAVTDDPRLAITASRVEHALYSYFQQQQHNMSESDAKRVAGKLARTLMAAMPATGDSISGIVPMLRAWLFANGADRDNISELTDVLLGVVKQGIVRANVELRGRPLSTSG